MACNFRAVMQAPRIRLPASDRPVPRVIAGMALVAALWAPGPTSAERADRGKPLNIEADSGRYDDARQIGLFSGNVVITKGSIVLRASQVEVRQTPDGHQSSVATGTGDALARFRQKREGLDEYIEGEAERIEYDTRADTVRFVNRAVLRRFRGSMLADEASGQVITFDNAASVYSVTGGTEASGGRVRATLSPRGDASPAGSPANGAAPPAAGSAPTSGTPRP